MSIDDELREVMKKLTGWRWSKGYAKLSEEDKTLLLQRLRARVEHEERERERVAKKNLEPDFPGVGCPDYYGLSEARFSCGGGRRIIWKPEIFS